MRILFISNYYPGDLGPLARLLGAAPENDVLFASNRQRRDFALPGVRRVRLKNCPPLFGEGLPGVTRIWEQALQRGGGGLRSLLTLRESWGMPDMVFASLAAGAAFFAPQAFPASFFVTYAESGLKNYSLLPAETRNTWALAQSTLLLQACLRFAFSEEERRLFPPLVREAIRLVPPCVDTDIFSRAAAAPWLGGEAGGEGSEGKGALLLTLNAIGCGARQLAGLVGVARAALREFPDCRVVILTENRGRSQALEAAAGAWPVEWRGRLAVYDSLPFLRYRDLLAASSVVVCPGGGETAMRAMLQAMSCEALLMAPAGAASFLRPGVNMLALPPLAGAGAGAQAKARATASVGAGPAPDSPSVPGPATTSLPAEEAVLAALRSRRGSGGAAAGPSPQGRTARRNVLAHFSEATVMPRHLTEVMQAWRAWKQERDRQRAR